MRFILASLLMSLVLTACKQEVPSSAARVEGDWNVEQKREWAASLRNEGLHDQAINVYEALIAEEGALSKNAIVGTSVVIAEIHMKKGRYADALASLLRATQLEPDAELSRKIDTWKIECLERLGKSAAADRMLDRAAAGSSTKGAAEGGTVVARIGEEEIRLADLESLIAQQPPELKARIDTKEGKLELLKNMVAQRVLERKARKLGLATDEKVTLAIDLATREILVRKLVADEVRKKLVLKPEDAKLYYEANRERFREPHQLEVAQIVVDGLEQEGVVRKAIADNGWDTACRTHSKDGSTRSKNGIVEGVIVEGRGHKVITDVQGLFAAVADTKEGDVAESSMKTSKGRHILKVLKRIDGRTLPFEKVKDAALKLLRQEREQAAVASMMQDALKQSDVKVFGDKLN